MCANSPVKIAPIIIYSNLHFYNKIVGVGHLILNCSANQKRKRGKRSGICDGIRAINTNSVAAAAARCNDTKTNSIISFLFCFIRLSTFRMWLIRTTQCTTNYVRIIWSLLRCVARFPQPQKATKFIISRYLHSVAFSRCVFRSDFSLRFFLSIN